MNLIYSELDEIALEMFRIYSTALTRGLHRRTPLKGRGDMDTNPEFEEKKRSQTTDMLHNLEEAHREDLEVIIQVLVKITNRAPEEIKPHLDTMLEHLIEPKKEPPTSEERSRAFREWVESHRWLNLPPLSDEAISRESIYGEKG